MLQWLGAADPGRVHTEGRMARFALEDARDAVAGLFGTRSRQVIFTSGATEAVNSATFGALRARPGPVALAAVEHSAVREACEQWAPGVLALGVDGTGRISVSAVAAAIDAGAGMVQCQLANHEVGTIQPVAEIAGMCRERGVVLHIDAAAGAGHLPIDFDRLGADLLSVSAHKLGGPAGAGALLVRRGLRIPPFIVGGAQERARRGGLENVAAAVGFGAAAAELTTCLAAEASVARARTDRLRAGLLAVPGVIDYGTASGLPNLVCVGIEGIEAEPVLIGLDRAGVAAHSGSSCSSESLEPSPVLEAMGVDGERSLRLSVGWSTTDAEVDLAIAAFPAVVEGLRRLR
jgi:cysteine desulfurase